MPLPSLPVDFRLGSCAVLRVLGQGGYGVTYLVQDARAEGGLGVIKEILPEGLALRDASWQVLPQDATGEGVEKLRAVQDAFTAEAEALMALHHRSVVEVTRVFRALGTTYVAMECIAGITLAEWRKKCGALSHEQVEYLLKCLLSALQYLHSHGVVHGDLREEHVRFRMDGTPVLIDFGVARRSIPEGGNNSSALSNYRRPQADLFALGAMMRRLISGDAAAASGRTAALTKDAGLVAAYGRSLLAGIDKAMNPNEGKGWQSAEDWLDALQGRFLSREARRRCAQVAMGAAAVLVLGGAATWGGLAIYDAFKKPVIVELTPGQKADIAYAEAQEWLKDRPAVPAQDGAAEIPARPASAVQSLACLVEAAELGHPLAPWELVDRYMRGLGTDPAKAQENDAQALRWCTVAANLGKPEAELLLSHMYRDGKGTDPDPAAAVTHLKVAANAGLAEAQYELACCYAEGKGVFADPEEAVRWYAEVGNKGEVRAQMELGRRYKAGDGVVMNHQESFHWYKMAAEAGVDEALYRVGLAYLEGSGTPLDVPAGVEALRRAAEKGMVEARYRLGHDMVEGRVPDADPAEAESFLKAAADAGHTVAQWELAELYAKGAEHREADAVAYYAKAARAGHVPALLALAEVYLAGRGIPCDAAELNALLTKAAEGGDVTAMLYAALASNPSAPDPDLLQRAADAGAADAWVYLGLLCNDAARAEELYRRAADKHSAFGEVMTAYATLSRGAAPEQMQEALSTLQRDVEHSSLYHGHTLLALGDVYLNAWGVEKDAAQALDYFKQAADAGNATAMLRLAGAYAGVQGAGLPGIETDAARAAEMYDKAAQKGSIEAACTLARMYDQGEGVAADAARAEALYVAAAKAGYAPALYELALRRRSALNAAADMESDERGTQEKAIADMLQKAAEGGVAAAMPLLSELYETGAGVEPAPDQAFYWARRGTEEGAGGAAWERLGTLYNAGVGTTADEREALKCWEKAAAAGNALGMFRYGMALYNATNGAKDSAVNKRAGRGYLLKAAQAGLPEAVTYVEKNKLNEQAPANAAATPSPSSTNRNSSSSNRSSGRTSSSRSSGRSSGRSRRR